MIHDFASSLKDAKSLDYDLFFENVYRKFFHNFERMESGTLAEDKQGIDRWVYLSNGKRYAMEEKLRSDRTDFDLALEYISVDRTKAPGWIEKDLLCDFLVYGFEKTYKRKSDLRVAYIFSWPILRRMWLHNRAGWLSPDDKNYIARARNKNNYTTLSKCIPMTLVYNCLRLASKVDLT